jgi:hypothetical protein
MGYNAMVIKETVSDAAIGIGHNGGPPLEPIDLTDLAREQEAAQTLNVKQGTLGTWRSLGKGPLFIKRGRTIWYPRAALRNYLAAGLMTPQPAHVRRFARANAPA